MPRRSSPPNREAIETALSPTLRTALAELVKAAGVSADRWTRVPHLLRAFGEAAARRIVDGQRADGSSLERALGAAGLQLGIPAETLRTWIRRTTEHAASSVQNEHRRRRGVA